MGAPSASIRASAEDARERQQQRFVGATGGADGTVTLLCNADMSPAEVRERCVLDDAGKSLCLHLAICWARLRATMTQLGMSAAGAFHRILKLAWACSANRV